MNTSIIIAQYEEDVAWIKKLSTNHKIYLYRKKPPNSYNDQFLAIYLPNIGREAHTFLYHIVNNYQNLSDLNVFIQGSPRIEITTINKIDTLKNFDQINLSKTEIIHLDKDHKITIWKKQKLDSINYNFFEWYNLNISNEPIKPPYKIYFEANFVVSKERILSRDIFFYQNLLNQLNTNNTEVAHFLERSWYYIFYHE